MSRFDIFRDCKHTRPVRDYKCVRDHGACSPSCPDYACDAAKREPTGHEWIKLTNKYYKRNDPGFYAKGIITFGCTYICTVRADATCALWYLTVTKDKEPICTCARFGKIRHAIQTGSDIIKHLIAEDINRVPKQSSTVGRP
jgi:hypothetical protein